MFLKNVKTFGWESIISKEQEGQCGWSIVNGKKKSYLWNRQKVNFIFLLKSIICTWLKKKNLNCNLAQHSEDSWFPYLVFKVISLYWKSLKYLFLTFSFTFYYEKWRFNYLNCTPKYIPHLSQIIVWKWLS